MLRCLALLVVAPLAVHAVFTGGSNFEYCRWIDSKTGAAFDLSPLDADEGHFAFHGVIGDHDSLLAATGAHASFALADYIYYINLCGPATNFHFDKCDGKPPAAAFQTHKDVATNDDCFALGSPEEVEAQLIDEGNPEAGLQLLFKGGDSCHKMIEHPVSSRKCEDTPGWKDLEGKTCADYAANHQCGAAYVASYGVDGVDAYSACCASCSDWWRKTVTCPSLDKPEHGHKLSYTNLRKWPSLATYECDSGYTLSGGYSKRECGPDGHWRGEAPECKEEQYYGRHGRYGRGRYHDYNNDENGDGYGGDSETVASLEAEVEVEWKHEPRQLLVNLTCDRAMTDSWEDMVNMAHAVFPIESEMCEYVIQWPSKYGCPLTAEEQAESWGRKPQNMGVLGWSASVLLPLLYIFLYRDGVRSRVLQALPPNVRSFFVRF